MDSFFEEPLFVGRPNIGNRDKLDARLKAILDGRWLSNNGPMVIEFERALARYLDVEHCISVCNATIAMEIVARALDLSGDVVVPTYSFIATAHAFRWLGLRPLFVDMDPKTHNIAPGLIESRITDATSAIVATHVWGRPCEIDAIQRIASKFNLPVIFDAAHAFGCSYNKRMLGRFGMCEIFSFHATKFLNSFEGGAITTNDADLAKKLRLVRNFGFEGFDNVTHLGTNGKMSEIHAAMGLTNLESIDYFIECNRRNYYAYKEGLRGLDGITVIHYDPDEFNNFQYVVVEVDATKAKRSRDEIVSFLVSRNVIARKYFWPGCHMMPYYRKLGEVIEFPANELIGGRVMVLPTGETVSPEIVDRICRMIRSILI